LVIWQILPPVFEPGGGNSNMYSSQGSGRNCTNFPTLRRIWGNHWHT